MTYRIGQEAPPASPRGFWMHTNFEMQGKYLCAKTYLVAMDTPVFFEMKLDVTPIIKAIREGHDALHASDGRWPMAEEPSAYPPSAIASEASRPSISGEGIPVNLVGLGGLELVGSTGVEIVGGAGNGIDIVGGYGIDIIGAAKSIMVNRVANASQAITKQIASQPSALSYQHPASLSAYAAANSLLASIEKQRLIDQAAHHTSISGEAVSEQVNAALPQLQAMVRDGKTARHVVGAVLNSPEPQAQKMSHLLNMVHEHRNHLRALGQYGNSTGRVVDEQGNIRNRIANPIPTVSQAVPQLAAAVSGIDHLSTLVGASHANIVGAGSCIGCGCIGCY